MATLFQKNWSNNYRYHGGWKSATRCILGTLASFTRPALPINYCDQLDVLTFSFLPSLTLIWLASISKLHLQRYPRIIIGDCSGGIWAKGKELPKFVNIFPFQNDAHGQKLDRFLLHYCKTEVVLVCDDDVFFLDAVPLAWGLSQLHSDPSIAVVSFVPRQRFTWKINQQEYIPMGSYCLLIRRDLWLKEKLSFRTVHQPSISPESYRGEYDTADFANVELLRRGYRVLIASPEIQAHLHISKGVSSALWEIQAQPELNSLEYLSRPREEIYTNLLFVRGIGDLVEEIFPRIAQNSPEWKSLLERSIDVLNERLSPEIAWGISEKVNHDIQKISSSLLETPNLSL
jgi:hypothetical protein